MVLAVRALRGRLCVPQLRIEDQHGFLQKTPHESLGPMKVLDSLPLFPASGAAARGDSRTLLELLTVNCRLLTRLSPLECAVPSKHRVLPGFGRSCPSVTSLECAVPKKGGGRVLAQDFLGAYQTELRPGACPLPGLQLQCPRS